MGEQDGPDRAPGATRLAVALGAADPATLRRVRRARWPRLVVWFRFFRQFDSARDVNGGPPAGRSSTLCGRRPAVELHHRRTTDDNPAMLIRAATEGDFEGIAEILNHYIRHTAVHFAYEPVATAELQQQWAHHRATYPFLVAEVDGGVLGFAKAGEWRARTAYSWTPECSVYVSAGRRRKGVGGALYARLFEILRAQGFHSVIAGIALPNDASVRLHEAFGFVAGGRVARAGWKHGRWHDVGFWQKDLADVGTAPGEIRPPIY
jgi:phosphinothricin acetyltransferase